MSIPVAVDGQVLIQGRVGATGYAGDKLKVVLERQKRDSAGAPEIVAEKEVKIGQHTVLVQAEGQHDHRRE